MEEEIRYWIAVNLGLTKVIFGVVGFSILYFFYRLLFKESLSI